VAAGTGNTSLEVIFFDVFDHDYEFLQWVGSSLPSSLPWVQAEGQSVLQNAGR
jgi:hypothetical protein